MANMNIVSAIRSELKQQVDGAIKNSYQRFFKEEVKFYGVKSATVGKMAKRYFQGLQHRSKKEIFALCGQLLISDYCEEAFIAFDWAYRLHDSFAPEDFKVFENWIMNYVNNWAKCDTLCNRTVGAFIEKYPDYIKGLKIWAKSENRWMRRASAVTLILPARKGRFLKDVFEIADSLLHDPDDIVQKGYGWMLKEASKTHENEVFLYVMSNKHDMPRTALRYAIEKMPRDLKVRAMEKGKVLH
jgi:3-methyladenine DNA glycosylase AlkD